MKLYKLKKRNLYLSYINPIDEERTKIPMFDPLMNFMLNPDVNLPLKIAK